VDRYKNRRRNWNYWPAARIDQVNQPPAAQRGDESCLKFWTDQGLRIRAATAAAAAGCRSLDELRAVGWRFFENRENCGTRTLQELSDLVGGWSDAPPRRGAWIRRVPDDTLIEEVQRRGLVFSGGDTA
jgi:hypothetical protein